jgi:F-type H+-transporting ATPase subunit gamma
MAKTREIKGRMKAVSNIKRITKTMQMIATARFQAALRRATASKPYSRKIAELVGELASAGESLDQPLLKKPDPASGRELLLVITSNRGLCGGYNANVLRTATQQIREKRGSDCDLTIEVVGKKGVGYFKFQHIDISQQHTQFGDEPKYVDVEELAERYMDEFREGRYDAISVAFMSFESTSRQRSVILNLLPLQPPSDGEASDSKPKADVEYDFSPDPEELLGVLLPETVKIQLFQCFNEAVVSEQVARMIAMKSATDAAGKMGKTLTRQYNRARQTAITTELTEIIGGTAALE